MGQQQFIVTYGDRVVLDYSSDPEGVHKTFPDEVSAIRYILASEGIYFRPEYFETVVGQMGGDWCRYTLDWSLDEIVRDVYKKFSHRFEMYKIYAVVS